MGSDLHMNPPYERCPSLTSLAKRTERQLHEAQSKIGELTARVAQLEEQTRKDSELIAHQARKLEEATSANAIALALGAIKGSGR